MVVRISSRVKIRLRRLRHKTSDKGLAMRCQIVLHAAKGWSSRKSAEAVGCSRSWVSRVLVRFDEDGEAGLLDRREDNGEVKVDADYLQRLYEVLERQPTDYGYSRPTWTRELLVRVMKQETGIAIHVSTMSRALKRIGARRGRPKPTVRCPWPKTRKKRRLRAIARLPTSCPTDEPVVHAGEVDIHLNPKIGLDWMNRGRQKQVVTPGQNEKRYLAGALDVRTGELICVEGAKKDSTLFLALLKALVDRYPTAARIHVVLDNYRIHASEITKLALQEFAKRIVLHFLPPYCPDHNRIERVWQDLHAEVTRNHQCRDMRDLMKNVRAFLRKRNATRRKTRRQLAA
jgi:transposase